MKNKTFFLIMALCLGFMICTAEDIKTIDGQVYTDVTGVKAMPDGIIFNLNPKNGIGIVKIPFSRLPEDIKKKYNYDPFEDGLAVARHNKVVDLKKDLAFGIEDMDVAKKRAQAEHKVLGFIMVSNEFFRPAVPMANGSAAGLADFYTVFHNGVVLVFVWQEDGLDKVPDAVKKGFTSPEEGGFAPNMAVVSADCSQLICEIPLGGDQSNGTTREEIFRQKISEIKKFMAENSK